MDRTVKKPSFSVFVSLFCPQLAVFQNTVWASRPCSLIPNATRATVIGGRGTAKIADGTLTVNVPEVLGYVWVKLE